MRGGRAVPVEPEITAEPACSRWQVAAPAGPSAPRRVLGVPEGVPIIMTGHQAQPWHPGIAAKFIAARALADACGGASVWIVPDQDTTNPWRVRTPVLDDGVLRAAEIDLAPPPAAGTPAALAPAQHAAAPTLDHAAVPAARDGLRRYADALDAHAESLSAAAQGTLAMRDLLGPAAAPEAIVYASELAPAGVMDQLLAAMREDPAACARAYNDAAAAVPEAGLARLRTGDRTELPLWHLTGRTRRKVFADQLGDLDPSSLAPRALTMTAVMRTALADLFIHGTGGGVYDRAMERWITGWLGSDLAPAVVVSATQRLDLAAHAPDEAAIARAVWTAHAAAHRPELLGDTAAAAEKAALVERLSSGGRPASDQAADFAAMQVLLSRVRTERRDALARLRDAAALAQRRRGSASLAHDRTWPVFLFDDKERAALERRVQEEIAAVPVTSAAPRSPA